MNMLRKTEDAINSIVDRGQMQLQERKYQRMQSSNNTEQVDSSDRYY